MRAVVPGIRRRGAGAGLASLYGWTSVEVVSALVIGVVCIAAYVYRQLRMETPVLDVRVFCQQGYRVGVALVMLNFGITLSAMYLLPQYIQAVCCCLWPWPACSCCPAAW